MTLAKVSEGLAVMTVGRSSSCTVPISLINCQVYRSGRCMDSCKILANLLSKKFEEANIISQKLLRFNQSQIGSIP